MGKWATSEYDRVLLEKVKQLFDSFHHTSLAADQPDTRFTTFIRNLDPNDRGVQACFHSLIQQQLYNHSRHHGLRLEDEAGPSRADVQLGSDHGLRGAYDDLVADNDEDHADWAVPANETHAEAPLPDSVIMNRRAMSLDLSMFPHSPFTPPPGYATFTDIVLSSPDPLAVDDPVDTYLHGSSRSSTSASTPRNRRRSASPSYSPSRARTIRLAEGFYHSDVDPPGASPPQSPSRAWLEEYTRSYPQTSSSSFALGPFPTDNFDFPLHPLEPPVTTRTRGTRAAPFERAVNRRRRYEERLDEDERVMAALRDTGSRRHRQDALPPTRSRSHRQGGPVRDSRRDGVLFDEPIVRLDSNAWTARPDVEARTGGAIFVGEPLNLPHRRHAMPPSDRRRQASVVPPYHDVYGSRPSSVLHVMTGREHVDDVVDPSLDAYHYIR